MAKKDEKAKELLVKELPSGEVQVTIPSGEVYSLKSLPNAWVTLLPEQYQAEARG